MYPSHLIQVFIPVSLQLFVTRTVELCFFTSTTVNSETTKYHLRRCITATSYGLRFMASLPSLHPFIAILHILRWEKVGKRWSEEGGPCYTSFFFFSSLCPSIWPVRFLSQNFRTYNCSTSNFLSFCAVAWAQEWDYEGAWDWEGRW